jgi:hypothetical protein
VAHSHLAFVGDETKQAKSILRKLFAVLVFISFLKTNRLWVKLTFRLVIAIFLEELFKLREGIFTMPDA